MNFVLLQALHMAKGVGIESSWMIRCLGLHAIHATLVLRICRYMQRILIPAAGIESISHSWRDAQGKARRVKDASDKGPSYGY